MKRCPYVGLRPFNTEDSHLFFGRSEQTTAILQCLYERRFVAVVGSSGCGKSSLVRAGVIPALIGGFLVNRRDRWSVGTMKPGDAPLRNLAETFLRVAGAPAAETQALVERVREEGTRVLVDLAAEFLHTSGNNLLLLVDQFEEVFRFVLRNTSHEVRYEGEDFVSAMLRLAAERDLPVFIVLTMRSDFITECDNYYGLPEALNQGQYVVPRLIRRQLGDAILGPARMCGAALSSRLVDRLLNEIGDASDQLPVLEHALMRTWTYWQQTSGTGEVDLENYEAIGTLVRALSIHAEEAMAGMSPEEQRCTRLLFQALVDVDASGRRARRQVHLSELEAITGAPQDVLRGIIGRFRSENRNFLVLSSDNPDHDPIIDISHESLIRLWKSMEVWLKEEEESRRHYLRIADAAEWYASKQGSLWGNPQLQLALTWRGVRHPTAAWANRYRPGFAEAMRFLDKSRRRRARNAIGKALVGIAFVAAFLSVPFSLYRDDVTQQIDRAESLAEVLRKIVRGRVRYVLSNDSSKILLWDDSGSVALRRVETWDAVGPWLRQNGPIVGALFSKDGSRILTWSGKNACQLWDSSAASVGISIPPVTRILSSVERHTDTVLEYLPVPGGVYRFSVSGKLTQIPPLHFGKTLVTNKAYNAFLGYLRGSEESRGLRQTLPENMFAASLIRLASQFEGFTKYLGPDRSSWVAKFRSPHHTDVRFSSDRQPVIGVTWYAAVAYCHWLTEITSRLDGTNEYVYRLPSEEEWEWAASGGTRLYPWGPEDPTKDRATYQKSGWKTTPVTSHPAGATPQGLLDMAGNAWEWMGNPYVPSRALRGGAWHSREGVWLRCDSRITSVPDEQANGNGFRVIRSLSGF